MQSDAPLKIITADGSKAVVWPLRKSTGLTLALLVCVSAGLLAMRTLPIATGLGALAVIWLGALPGLLYLQGIARPPLPFLPFAGLYYVIFFGLPTFAWPLAYRVDDHVVLYQRIILALTSPEIPALVAAGLAAMLAVFYLARYVVFARMGRFRLPDSSPPDRILNVLFGVLLLASLAYRYIVSLQTLPSIGELLGPVEYLSFGGLYIQWCRGKLPSIVAFGLVAIALPLEIFARLRFLFITDLLLFFLFFGFLLWRMGKTKTIAVLVGASLVVILAYNATTTFRSLFPTFVEKVAGSTSGFAAILSDGPYDNRLGAGGFPISYDPRLSPLINRIGQIWVFQTVYERTPDLVPYWQGETYRPLFTSFVPRLFYPGKPEERAGAAFGYRYGFTPLSDGSTSFNIPWIVELLGNFGPAGVLIGMAAIGIFLAVFDRLFNAPGMSDLEWLIGLTIIFRLGYQEANFSVMTGALLPLFLCLYVYFGFGVSMGKVVLRRLRVGERT